MEIVGLTLHILYVIACFWILWIIVDEVMSWQKLGHDVDAILVILMIVSSSLWPFAAYVGWRIEVHDKAVNDEKMC